MSTTRPEWLDDEEMRAWRGLVEAYAELQAALEADLVSGFGIDGGDYGVLVNLSEAPDQRLRMCDLAARLHLSPSGLTRRLDGLVKAGYVIKEKDGRRNRYHIQAHLPLSEPVSRERTIGEVLALLVGAGPAAK